MAGDINFGFNFEKLPESPIFWILVAIVLFVVLLASGHLATAVTFLFLAISIVTFVTNITRAKQNVALWWVCVICLVLALFVGLTFVYDEWQPPITQIPHTLPPIKTTHAQ